VHAVSPQCPGAADITSPSSVRHLAVLAHFTDEEDKAQHRDFLRGWERDVLWAS
jgi:hypothetical protein